MRLGIVCRGEDRGLGHLTWEMHRNLQPDRTLLVDLGDLARGFPIHAERYPDALRVSWDGGPLDADGEAAVRWFLDGLDVVYSAETFYDWRIVDWAREAGVATVLHTMPEFWRCGTDGIPMPDAVWAPTSWRLDHLPEATRLVPVPVALDRLDRHIRIEEPGAPLRVLHVAGHRAAQDRNGTQTVLRAVRHITERVELTVVGQDGRLPSGHARRGGPCRVISKPAGTRNYWELYAGQDVLVMPRRYGGLCLPVQEGLAAGLVPILPDCSPNGDWPAVLIPARRLGTIATQAGVLPTFQCRPSDVAAAIDRLAKDRGTLNERRKDAHRWARDHSWDALAGLYRDELERAR